MSAVAHESILAGRYRLIRILGSGSGGAVYYAEDVRARTVVAVKLLHEHLLQDAAYLHRFRREARIAQRLNSPYIVRVHDFGRDGAQYYLVMECVEGRTLRQLLLERGRLDGDEALAIAFQVASGLDTANRLGVVHRDVKPSNILVTTDGYVKLSDFGVARIADAATITAPSVFIGTLAYAAPEAFAGRTDIRSDLYSLGIVLYEMVTGRTPFEAPTPAGLMEMHLRREPPALEQLDSLGDGKLGIVRKLLAKDPWQRYQTPRELLAALEKTGRPGLRAAHPLPSSRGVARYLLVAGLSVVVVVALVVAGLVFAGGGSTSGSPTSATPSSVPNRTGVAADAAFDLLPARVLQAEDIGQGAQLLDSSFASASQLADRAVRPDFARRQLERWGFILSHGRQYTSNDSLATLWIATETWLLADERSADEAFIDGALAPAAPAATSAEYLAAFGAFGDDSSAFAVRVPFTNPDGSQVEAQGYDVVIRVGRYLSLLEVVSSSEAVAQSRVAELAAALELRLKGD